MLKFTKDTHFDSIRGICFQGFYEFKDGGLAVLYCSEGERLVVTFNADRFCTNASTFKDRHEAWKLFVGIVQSELQKLKRKPKRKHPKKVAPPLPAYPIFRKWYGVASREDGEMGCWCVVRVDKEGGKGTRVGPVQIRGKNWYEIARERANERNRETLAQREEKIKELKKLGLSTEDIEKIQVHASEAVRKEMGDDYKERDP